MAHSQNKTDKIRCVHIYISWTRWNGDGFTCYLRPWTRLRTDKTRCHFCSGHAQWLGLLTGIGAIVSWQMHTAKDSWPRLKTVSRALRLGSLLFFCVLGLFLGSELTDMSTEVCHWHVTTKGVGWFLYISWFSCRVDTVFDDLQEQNIGVNTCMILL